VDKEIETLRVMTPGDMERMEQDKKIKEQLSRINRKILVMSGKGGVGKSTVAAYLALLLSRKGRRVGLLDVDLHGPSIPRLLNIQGGFQIAGQGLVRPYSFSKNLKVASMEMVLGDRDAALIWRGPLKISAIRQFMSDIDWGDTDYLVIDSPPGTGDEPLTVAQTIPDAEAVVVTTPQEISLADVRKSINFCHKVKMKILGVIENMSGFACPHCNQKITIFGEGGGTEMAEHMEVPILGEIPMDHRIIDLGDKGELAALLDSGNLEMNRAYNQVVERIEERRLG
jgi:Mrp family chromosome partitioning ATPase